MGMAEIWLEPLFQKRRWISRAMILGLVGSTVWFSVEWVCAPARLDITISDGPSEHPVGSKVNGVDWSDKLSDLRINLQNLSNADYSDVDLYFRPKDNLIVHVEEVTHQHVTILTDDPYSNVRQIPIGTQLFEIPDNATNDYGFRVVMPRFVHQSRVELFIATKHVEWPTGNNPEKTAEFIGRAIPVRPNVWKMLPDDIPPDAVQEGSRIY
jgi:hypothetical protein